MKHFRPAAVFFLLAAALGVVFIFYNSTQSGDLSYSRSFELLMRLQARFPSLSFLTNHIVRKCAHVAEYTALGFMLANLWYFAASSRRYRIIGFVLSSFSIPFIDEGIQFFSDGRDCRLTDVMIDSCGILLGAFAAVLLISIVSHIRRRAHRNDKHYSFFCNRECEYFPCHRTDDPENFNCLFCYCPLYALGDKCGGAFTYNEKGYKDCTACNFPHIRENYGRIIARYGEIAELARKKD